MQKNLIGPVIIYFRVKIINEWHESIFHQLESFPPRLFRIFVSPAQTFPVLAFLVELGGLKLRCRRLHN